MASKHRVDLVMLKYCEPQSHCYRQLAKLLSKLLARNFSVSRLQVPLGLTSSAIASASGLFGFVRFCADLRPVRAQGKTCMLRSLVTGAEMASAVLPGGGLSVEGTSP